VGNPPYVRQEQIKELKPKLKDRYECYSGTADLYVYFYERAIRLLRQGGGFSFISSNKWMRSGYGEKLRAWLVRKAKLKYLIDFGDAPVFTAIAYPCIVVLTKDESLGAFDERGFEAGPRVFTWEPGPPVEKFAEVFYERGFALPQTRLKPDGWRLESGAKLNLLDRMRAAGTPLGEYVKGRFYYGIKTGLNEAFVIDGATRKRLIAEHSSSEEVIKPFLRGQDVKRWRIEFDDQYLITIESSENVQHAWSGRKEPDAERVFAKAHPAIYARLKPMKSELMARTDQGHYYWELRSCAYWREFDRPKIIYPDIYEHQSFSWDARGYCAANTCYFIPTQERWLTALLNSSSIEWLYSQLSNRIRGGYLRAFTDSMRLVPVPQVALAGQETLSRLTEYLVVLSQHSTENVESANAKAYFEQLVNGLVYELFFPEDLHLQKLFLFKYVEEAGLPVLDSLQKARRLEAIHEAFGKIYDLKHPIRSCLFALRALEIVRIIEGEA
jgi:hypothetical protein